MSNNKINLRQIRKNQRLTQSEFSKILGVSRSIITKIESDEVSLSKNMIQKLKETFPNEFGFPVDRSEGFGNGSENDILLERINVNLSNISQVKFLLEQMCINTSFIFNESLFLKCFIGTSNRLKFNENLVNFENTTILYEYRFLIDFFGITKECLYSAYEDLFNLASVKYIYDDQETQKKMLKKLNGDDAKK